MRFQKPALLALVFCATFVARGADLTWHNPPHGPFFWREISRTADALYLPSNGAFLRSTNGADWSLKYQPFDSLFFSVAQSPEKFLAAASTGSFSESAGTPTLFISTNGIDFSLLQAAPHHIYKLVYGKGRFVGAGFDMSHSADSIHWTLVTNIAPGNVFQPGDLIFEGSRFLRATGKAVSVSEDGVTWTNTGPAGERLSYYNGVYLLAGNGGVSYSTNGRAWRTQTISVPQPVRAAAIGAPGAILVGDSLDKPTADAIFSADGTNWINFNLPFANRPWDIKFIDNEFLMIGDGGLIAHSTDGTNWTSHTQNPSVHIAEAAEGAGRLIAVGTDGFGTGLALWSSNAISWKPLDVGKVKDMRSIAFQNGTFVTVGNAGQILASTNGGDNWAKLTPVTDQPLYKVIATPSGFVATGHSVILSSSNALDWEVAAQVNGTVLDIAYGNQKYIAIFSTDIDGGASISQDLKNWQLLPRPYRLASTVEFGNGRFVLGRYSSTDGVNWQSGGADASLYNMVFSEGVFCAVSGQAGWYDPAEGYVSTDGLHWHRLFELPAFGLKTGKFFGRFLGFGSYGGIFETQNFGILDLGQNADGSLSLQSIHPENLNSDIESSEDLVTWKPVPLPALPFMPHGNTFFRMNLQTAP